MIGEMRSRITLKSWGSYQDEGGGPVPLLLNSYTIWAKVKARNGQLYTGEQQAIWPYDYEVSCRYEKTRVIASNFTVDFDGKRLAINSVSFKNEGNRKDTVLACRTIDANINTDNDIFATVGTWDYYGIGGEDEFTAASDVTPIGAAPTIPIDLRNKTIIGAFKDGIEFAVLLGGIPSPLAKEVVYNAGTGNFLWSIPYEPDEHTLIQFVQPCDCES